MAGDLLARLDAAIAELDPGRAGGQWGG